MGVRQLGKRQDSWDGWDETVGTDQKWDSWDRPKVGQLGQTKNVSFL